MKEVIVERIESSQDIDSFLKLLWTAPKGIRFDRHKEAGIRALQMNNISVGSDMMSTLQLLAIFLNDDDAPVIFEALSLWTNMLRSEHLKVLASSMTFNGSLRVLDVSNNHIGDDGIAFLCANLDVSFCQSALNIHA